MTAATNLSELAKEETDAITAEANAAEVAELQTIFGSERKDTTSRAYRAAMSDLEKLQKQKAKRRVLDVIDRALMDLVSVYRDAIALAVGAPGQLVNEELRGDVAILVARRVTRDAAPDDRRDLPGARADAGVQRAAPARPGIDDGRPAAARGRSLTMKKVVALLAVLALLLAAVVTVGLAVGGMSRRRLPSHHVVRPLPHRPSPRPPRSPSRPSRSWPTSTPRPSTGRPAPATTATTAAR